jgi:phage terminase large subunit-like protein
VNLPFQNIDLSALSFEEKREVYDLLREKELRKKRNRLADYKPYGRQLEFHSAGSEYRERLFMAANQCLSPWSWVETPESTALSGEVFFEVGARVQAWGGESRCVGQVRRGYLKGIEPAFRLVLGSGGYLDCSPNHRILTESGWLSLAQIVSLSSGLRWSQTVEDYQANCVERGHLRDPQLPLAADTAPARLLSQAGAQIHTLSFSREDAEERVFRYTSALLNADQISNPGAGSLRVDLFALFAGPAHDKTVLPLTYAHREIVRLAHESGVASRQGLLPQLPAEAALCLASRPAESYVSVNTSAAHLSIPPSVEQSPGARSPSCSIEELFQDAGRLAIFYPFETPALIGGAAIEAIVPIGYQPIVDCSIPDYHNYVAAGIISHNSGKTYSGAFEVAMHTTGRYPDWWTGRRFPRAVRVIVGSETAELTRKGQQRILLGPPEIREDWGTGAIPHDRLVDTSLRQGVPDAVASCLVKHVSGENSIIQFASYDQGRSRWQADTVDVVWLDEEAPMSIYTEALTRTNATGGMVFTTFTPLLGMSDVVKRFLLDKPSGTTVTSMTIHDVEHYTDEQRAAIIASYPEHERDARTKGIPSMGSGRVFPLADEAVAISPFQIPDHWPRIVGLDFGIDHPTAAVWLAWDRDTDTIYVTDTYRVKDTGIVPHAASIRMRGDWIPVAWPHDGLQRDKGSGQQLAAQYRDQGLAMLKERATFDDGSNGLEAGVAEMLQRMQTRRLRVFSHLSEWFEEFRLYHRKDGRIVDKVDDLLAATRYGIMMKRHAKTKADTQSRFGFDAAPAVSFGVFDPVAGY